MKGKILVLLCGGTIIMVENQEGVLAPPDKNAALNSVVNLEPRIHDLAAIDVMFVANIDSSDMTPDLWDRIARIIFDNYAKYDGFVITHGTDTMAYTASALTFSLGDLGKPVVLTGAQIPGHHLESDARRNFVNAIRVALMDIAGVVIAFGSKVILGARATKLSHYKLEAFVSVNALPLAEIGAHTEFSSSSRKRHAKELHLHQGFDPRIAVFALVPGMPIVELNAVLGANAHGIVLEAFGSGNIPHLCLPFLQLARDKKVPVVIRTQCLEGGTRMGTYETGKQALNLNAIEVYDMSREATATKLMWALKRGVGYEHIREIMQRNYAGEIIFQ